jgi:hypothetical protein
MKSTASGEFDEARSPLSRPRPKLARGDPVGQVLRRLLLEEHLAVDPVRIALHCERTVAEVRNERRRDALVIRKEIAFRDPVIGIEDAIGGAQLHLRQDRHP